MNRPYFITAGVTQPQRRGVPFLFMSISFIFHMLEIQGLGATAAECPQ
jgi:hypothetical protein